MGTCGVKYSSPPVRRCGAGTGRQRQAHGKGGGEGGRARGAPARLAPSALARHERALLSCPSPIHERRGGATTPPPATARYRPVPLTAAAAALPHHPPGWLLPPQLFISPGLCGPLLSLQSKPPSLSTSLSTTSERLALLLHPPSPQCSSLSVVSRCGLELADGDEARIAVCVSRPPRRRRTAGRGREERCAGMLSTGFLEL